MDIREMIRSKEMRAHLSLVFDWLHNSLTETFTTDNGETTSKMAPSGNALKMVRDYLYSTLKEQSHKNIKSNGTNVITECHHYPVFIAIDDAKVMTFKEYYLFDRTKGLKIMRCNNDVYRFYEHHTHNTHYLVLNRDGLYRIRNVAVGIIEGCYYDMPPNMNRLKEHYINYTENVLSLALELIYQH